ncbi:hypothetical protein C8P68_11062 [Mucilaginibacter yixingensis]|uniref:Gliding motility-associated-like protein n=2 Tax=Mucilaginibacter yixingensis TaxID=1295612 RepID=A0A2T5J527_9SPHI|nr:hypothetical protein C8P68_11062 [Mucilaginibacter yixingensis]
MLFAAPLLYAQTGGSCPLNMDFEMGDFTNWQCLTGNAQVQTINNVLVNVIAVNPTPPTANAQAIIAKSKALDKWGGFPIASPNGSNYTIKLGNDLSGGQASEVTYTFTVPTSGDDFSVTYACAIAFRTGEHWDIQQPRFLVKVYNIDDKSYIDCAESDYISTPALQGFQQSTVAPDVVYKPWFNTTLNFSAYKGKKLRLEFTAAGCTLGGHFGYAYIDVNKICSNPIVGIDFCNTATNITLTGPTGYAGYKWYNADRSKVLGTASTLVFPTAPADGTVVNVDLTPNPGMGCAATTATTLHNHGPWLTITNPAPACYLGKVDITSKQVVAATGTGIVLSYWKDAQATVPLTDNPTAVGTSGTYYVKATNDLGCAVIKPVTVTINPLPDLRITDPKPVCIGGALDLTAPAVTAGSVQGLTLSYWTDAAATQPLNNPSAVTTAGTYYIKGINAMGCPVVKPVKAAFYALPDLTITDPAPVCYPAKVNLTSAVYNNTGDNITLTYWQDAQATNPLSSAEVGTTGTYYIKATNVTGCVTIKAVNVVVNALPVLVINQPADVCYAGKVDLTAAAVTAGTTGNPTFTYWRDAAATLPLINYAAVADSGSYYIKATNASGCFTIKMVNVVIKPLPDLRITDPKPVCIGGTLDLTATAVTAGSVQGLTLSYWTDAAATQQLNNPSAVTVAGTYYIKGINAMGCPVVKPVKAAFYALPDLTITDPAPVCYPAKVSLASAVHNNTADNITLTYWQDAQATNPLSSAEVGITGTYYIKATNVTGCVTIKAVNVVVNALPVLVINQPADVCYAGKVDLTAAAVTAGTTGNPTFTYWRDAAATLPLINYAAVADSGSYYIKATNASGCFTIKMVNVVIKPLPDLRITDPKPVCVGNTINLKAAAITAGSAQGLTLSYWTDAAATHPLNNPTAVSVTNTYYIQGINAMGCTVIKPVKATFYESPDFAVVDPAPVCYPAKVNIASAVHSSMGDNVSISYWKDALGTISLTNTEVTIGGTYYVKATNAAGCFTMKAVNVVVNALPELVINQPADICMPGRVDLSASYITAGSSSKLTFTYWRDAAATTPLTNYRAVADSGRYYIKATNTSGCYTVGAVLVNVHRLPVVYTQPLKALYQPRTVDLTQAVDMSRSTSNATYTYWANSSLTVPVKNPKAVGETGTYYIKAANAYGCYVVAPVEVFLAPVPDILVPTAFTPMQVTNNKLYPFLKGVKVFKFFKLYNRWGNMVYETNDASADKGWDGQFKGAIAFLDTFTWVSEGVDYLGNIVHRSGNTVLLK